MNKKIIIIGSGIAGLTLAIALEKRGFQVQLFESAPKLEPVGAGIWMAPNAMKVFSDLGISDEICRNGRVLSSVRICDSKLKPIQLTNLSETKNKFGFSIVAIHRSKLQQILLNHIVSASPQCGYSFDSFEEDGNRVLAKFTNGKTVEGDILIGADGLHSKVRKQMFGDMAHRYSGLTCFRGVAQFSLPMELRDVSFELWGGKNRIGFSEISNGNVYWYITYKSPLGKMLPKEHIKENLLNRMTSFDPMTVGLIESTDVTKIIQSDLLDLVPFHPWSKNNVCLMGDAAHPMTPNLGQGGAQAVLDAFYLAKSLSENSDSQSAFKNFERGRSKKVDTIVKTSFLSGKFAHLEFGASFRNFILRRVPNKLSENSFNNIFRID